MVALSKAHLVQFVAGLDMESQIARSWRIHSDGKWLLIVEMTQADDTNINAEVPVAATEMLLILSLLINI